MLADSHAGYSVFYVCVLDTLVSDVYTCLCAWLCAHMHMCFCTIIHEKMHSQAPVPRCQLFPHLQLALNTNLVVGIYHVICKTCQCITGVDAGRHSVAAHDYMAVRQDGLSYGLQIKFSVRTVTIPFRWFQQKRT